jgi:hypothetical protein
MSDAGTAAASGSGAGAAAGSTAAAAAATAGTGAGGSPGGDAAAGVAAFLAQIPEDIRTEAYFKDIKDVPNLATRAFNQAKLIGVPPEQLIRLAGPDDKPGWDAIYNKLGRPESADKYALADPAAPPAGFNLNPELKTNFAAKAHELGLGQKQADALYQWWNGQRIDAFTRMVGSEADGLRAADATLKTKWGAAYGEKLLNSEAAVAHLDQTLNLGGQLREAIGKMPSEARVALSEVFAHLGGQMVEDKVIGRAAGGTGNGALAPAEAMQQINDMYADPAMAKTLMDKAAIGHDDAVAKLMRLSEFAAATAAA